MRFLFPPHIAHLSHSTFVCLVLISLSAPLSSTHVRFSFPQVFADAGL